MSRTRRENEFMAAELANLVAENARLSAEVERLRGELSWTTETARVIERHCDAADEALEDVDNGIDIWAVRDLLKQERVERARLTAERDAAVASLVCVFKRPGFKGDPAATWEMVDFWRARPEEAARLAARPEPETERR